MSAHIDWKLLSFRNYVSWLIRYLDDDGKRAFILIAISDLEDTKKTLGKSLAVGERV